MEEERQVVDNDASGFIRKEFEDSFVHKYHDVFLRTGPLSENPLEMRLSLLDFADQDGDCLDGEEAGEGGSVKTGGGKKRSVGDLGSREDGVMVKKGRKAQHSEEKDTAAEVEQEAVVVSSKDMVRCCLRVMRPFLF